jgi:hypothetical protein
MFWLPWNILDGGGQVFVGLIAAKAGSDSQIKNLYVLWLTLLLFLLLEPQTRAMDVDATSVFKQWYW